MTTIFEKSQSLDRLIERDQEEMRLEDEYIWALVNQNKDQHEKIVQKIAQKENVRLLDRLHSFDVTMFSGNGSATGQTGRSSKEQSKD